MADGGAGPKKRRSTGERSAVALDLGLAQIISKEKRLEYRWAESVLRRQGAEAAEALDNSAAAADADTTTPATTTTSTLATAPPSERLSRRLALSINPGWIPAAASSVKSTTAEAFAAPASSDSAATLLRLSLAADAAAIRASAAASMVSPSRARSGALAFHKRSDSYTAYVEAAAKARLVARGGYGGGGGGGGGGKNAGAA
jgi:hypothetical protein